ncbi:MAG: dienelactone hydrolase family protein [Archangium sp.]|nr:dienelactone hydrolase family protein [Archangium sp.]
MTWELDSHQGLPYRVLLPSPYTPHNRRYPVVVYLHGSGERGTDTWAQLKNGIRIFEQPVLQSRFPAIVVAPQAPPGATFGGSWYGGTSDTQRAVLSLIESLRGRQSVDPRRVGLIGFSMGAIGGWDMVVRRPELFSAFVALAGDLNPTDVDSLNVPTWAFHGAEDTLVSNQATRAAYERAKRRNLELRYTEVPGVGHNVWQPAFEHPGLYDWLFAQSRSG